MQSKFEFTSSGIQLDLWSPRLGMASPVEIDCCDDQSRIRFIGCPRNPGRLTVSLPEAFNLTTGTVFIVAEGQRQALENPYRFPEFRLAEPYYPEQWLTAICDPHPQAKFARIHLLRGLLMLSLPDSWPRARLQAQLLQAQLTAG